jgi:hypothetical protein
MTKNVRHQVAASYGREAKGSYADMQMKAYTQQCRDGEREPMFTPETFGETDFGECDFDITDWSD